LAHFAANSSAVAQISRSWWLATSWLIASRSSRLMSANTFDVPDSPLPILDGCSGSSSVVDRFDTANILRVEWVAYQAALECRAKGLLRSAFCTLPGVERRPLLHVYVDPGTSNSGWGVLQEYVIVSTRSDC
jgi:hypothetical protein